MSITWHYQKQRGIESISSNNFQGELLSPGNIYGNIENQLHWLWMLLKIINCSLKYCNLNNLSHIILYHLFEYCKYHSTQ